MIETTNLKLKKWQGTDLVSDVLSWYNSNLDLLDTNISLRESKAIRSYATSFQIPNVGLWRITLYSGGMYWEAIVTPSNYLIDLAKLGMTNVAYDQPTGSFSGPDAFYVMAIKIA